MYTTTCVKCKETFNNEIGQCKACCNDICYNCLVDLHGKEDVDAMIYGCEDIICNECLSLKESE